MALWQYSFYIIPRESFEEFGITISSKDKKQEFDDEYFWRYKPIHKSFFKELNSFLPRNASWSPNIDLYGEQESNCIEVLFDKLIVLSVSLRIDFRKSYDIILSFVLEFCISHDLVILDNNLDKVLLNLESFKALIDNSVQKEKFVRLLS